MSGSEEFKSASSESEFEFDDTEQKFRSKTTGQFVKRAAAEKARADKKRQLEETKAKAKMAEFNKIRLPTWDGEDPELWFQLCEDTFFLAGCEEQVPRAILVQKQLPSSVTSKVRQYITKPNKDTRYDDLKKAILAQHKLSPREAWAKIGAMTLGDQKPSQLGQAMLAAIPSTCGDDTKGEGCGHKKWLMDNLFDQKLPPTVRNGLASMELNVKNPTDYFAQADKLLASAKARQTQVSEVEKESEVDYVKGGSRRDQGGAGARKGTGKKTRPNDICAIHIRHGEKAWKCAEPDKCKFAKTLAAKPTDKKE